MIIKKKNRIILFDKDEILKNRKTNKKVFFNIISNRWGYRNELQQFLDENKYLKNCIKSIYIYCKNIQKYSDLKRKDLIYDVTQSPIPNPH